VGFSVPHFPQQFPQFYKSELAAKPPCFHDILFMLASQDYCRVIRVAMALATLDRVRTAQQARWEEQDGPNQVQNTMNRNAYDPEWQQQKPNEWVKRQGQQCQWPAKDEQDAPQQETRHRFPPCSTIRIRGTQCFLNQEVPELQALRYGFGNFRFHFHV